MSSSSQTFKGTKVIQVDGVSSDSDRVLLGWTVAKICALVALVVLFNFFPERIGAIVSADEPWSFIPLLAPEFYGHVPWLTLWWGLSVALNVTNLCFRRWRLLTRWVEWGLSFLGIVILLRLVLGGPIVGLDAEWVVRQAPPDPLLVRMEQRVIPILNVMLRGGLAIALVTVVAEASMKLTRLLQGRPAPR